MKLVSYYKRQLFISYAGKDRKVAWQLKADIEHHGFQVWLDVGEIGPGEHWDDCIRQEIKKSLVVLYLASPDSRSSPNVFHEIGLAKMYGCPIWPLWIAGAKWVDVAIFGFYSVHYIDLRAEHYSDGLALLLKHLRHMLVEPSESSDLPVSGPEETLMPEKKRKWFARLFQTATTEKKIVSSPVPRLRNPYKGLYAFEYRDARDFFGRKHLVGEMLQEVRHIFNEERHNSQVPRCVLVIGASGAGKSSVAMAGLLPALQQSQDIPEIKRWLFLEPVCPGEHPVYRLVHVLKCPYLNKAQVGDSPLMQRATISVQQELEEPAARGLHNLLQSLAPDSHDRVVLVIDQLEELFAPAVNPSERELFINLLFAAATEPYSRALIIVTLRADFYDYVLKYPRLFSIVKAHKIDVPPMTAQELREVVEEPARLPDVMVTFDPDLVGDLIFDMRGRPGALPLLQFVLEKLFERREGHHLTRRSYEELGGLQGAINKHADDIFDNLPTEKHREYTRHLFAHHLIHIMESSQELAMLESGEEIIRRRATRAELQLDEPQNVVARQTIDAFTQARLLTARNATGHSTRLEESTYEISHEVLINAWKRLASWIEHDRQNIYLRQRLRSHMLQWQRETNRKKKRELLVDRRELRQLQAYGRSVGLTRQEKQFLKYNEHYYLQRIVRYSVMWLLLLVIFVPISQWALSRIFPDPSVVTSLLDSGSGTLRQAIDRASPGAKITFAADLRGNIVLTNDLTIDKNITISGPENESITITTDQTGKSIDILPGGDVTFDNIVFAKSYTHKKSLIMNDGNLTLNHCQMTNNSSYGNGGAIDNGGEINTNHKIFINKANLVLNDTILSNNQDSGNGGAIYNLFGTVNINGGSIDKNLAYNNGGGIYSLGGQVEISGAYLSANRTWDVTAQNNYGGGIDMVDGSLIMTGGTKVSGNSSKSYGGGLAIQGSIASISDTFIDNTNSAGVKDGGGGIIVAINTDNNFFSLVILHDITVTDEYDANTYNISRDSIAGKVTQVGSIFQITDVTGSIGPAGNPSTNRFPQHTPNFVGVADINAFCLHEGYSYGQIAQQSVMIDQRADIAVSCLQLHSEQSGVFAGQQVCQEQFPDGRAVIVDRLVNYFDPSTLQCYRNVRFLGPIGNNAADFARACSAEPHNTGLYDNQSERLTAYDWQCQPRQRGALPRGLSVTEACIMKYGVASAFDRLVNYREPSGWECWAPA